MKHQSIDSDSIIGSIGKRRYVSFDIFDTLILRPYVRPTDLFRHLERLTGRTGFADIRHSAEMSVRRKLEREVTLKEIYADMPEYIDLMQTETDMEISVTSLNNEILGLINKLRRSGKRIVLISDMYLPKETIEKILNSSGFTDYDGLYVSSEYGRSKHTGELYDLVINDLNITCNEIFHIGDNRHSDYDVPKKKGIDAYLYTRPLDRYISAHKDEYRAYRRDRTLDNSILIGMDVLHEINDDGWFELGYRFGGPLANAYSLFILNGMRDGQKLLFASRDGYNLKRIADEVFNVPGTYYVYVQRLIMDVLTEHKVKYGPIDMPNRNSDRYAYESTVNAMKHIIAFFADELKLNDNLARDSIPKFYNDNIQTIDSLRKDGLEQYRSYLFDKCQNDDVCLVDCTTMKYSSQKLVETVLGRKIDGCYLVTIEDNKEYRHRTMHMKEGLMIGWSRINIPEFFLSSPELPLIGWNKEPKHGDVHECERFRASIYDRVSDGELAYARDFNKIFGRYAFPLEYTAVVNWSALAAIRGTESCESLKKIKWASDPDHSVYQSLIPNGSTLLYYLKNTVSSVISKMNDK